MLKKNEMHEMNYAYWRLYCIFLTLKCIKNSNLFLRVVQIVSTVKSCKFKCINYYQMLRKIIQLPSEGVCAVRVVILNESMCGEAVGIFGISLTVSKWKALEQMVNQMCRVTGNPSCPFPHPGVMPFLDGGQQTAKEPLTSAENMLDLVPTSGDSLSKSICDV